MFKKLKDKLAEEVKSSPQRIQQFAQAAQAAVTSASSSISDITNNDLFSIGDNDTQKTPTKAPSTNNRNDSFQHVSLTPQSASSVPNTESSDYFPNDIVETQRQRRLSNSSFASDVSFKLPSYESPSMYHFQSDMDVSGSEAEERGLAGGAPSLERVTKEQLFAAYRRTQQRYAKYRSQYADLARHYKLLERENAKARSVLVETQDKALRRISELREQCSLEQSAKAHLERALREDIDEKSIKIDTLTTKVKLLQSNSSESEETTNESIQDPQSRYQEAQLVDLSIASEAPVDTESASVTALNNKIEKMEQLMNKYKESLKAIKEKNSQLTTEFQLVSNELDNKMKEIEQLNSTTAHLAEARNQIQELKDINEELQNKINTYDFTKTKEASTLEIDYRKAQKEITQLKSKISTFSKREEEYAISLAENKLSIHKELESKEAEIKALKDNLSESKKEVQSLSIVISDYKNNVATLEEERAKLKIDISELKKNYKIASEKEIELDSLKKKYQTLEQFKIKAEEAYKCLELQAKQETAEKLAIIDRNSYLENRNKQISDENAKKTAQLTKLESELEELRQDKQTDEEIIVEKSKSSDEIRLWKDRYNTLQLEIQEEREELVKLQSEIEKLLSNHDLVQTENSELKDLVTQLKSENYKNQEAFVIFKERITSNLDSLKNKSNGLRNLVAEVTDEIRTFKHFSTETETLANNINNVLKLLCHENEIKEMKASCDSLNRQYESSLGEVEAFKVEKEKLLDKIHYLETENERFLVEHQQLLQTTDQLAKLLAEMEILNNENSAMALKIYETEEECGKLRSELKQANSRYELELKKLQTKFEEQASKAREQEITYTARLDDFNKIKMENLALATKVQNAKDNKTDAEKLHKNVAELKHENSKLKNNFESIVSNFKTLEKELAEVRQSHSEIESEKDRLSSIIEIFEQNELKKSARDSRETQTIEDFEDLQTQLNNAVEETNILKTKCEEVKQEKEDLYEQVMVLQQKNSDNKKNIDDKQRAINHTTPQFEKLQYEYEQQTIELDKLKEANTDLSCKLSENVTQDIDALQKRETLEAECDLLRDENRRLQSDIEGLQTYLTKMSKENGTLNDKLREIIATSEGAELHDMSELTRDIERLKNEIELEKEKSIDLVRQNTLLAEENLELKDQLQSQNYVHPVEIKVNELNANELSHSGSELATLKDRYNNEIKSKKELEDKLHNSEQMNQTVNNNVKQLQESNHKLRTTNEKLERRLDEALVSLRHLHSLQENTELEYLRNILYEYLTGSGTHSETLAKVLAAVVKFDDKQTQQVLQKERERQGLLRQLGLL